MSDIKTYKIEQGDCLSLISQKFNIDEEVLMSLNSDQIKDIDIIYAGNTIKLTGNEASPIKVEVGKRITLPLPPDKPACGNDLCSSKVPDYIDILYLPAHPVTGTQTWYALTKEAQEAVLSEQEIFKNAIDKNQETTFDNLNALGILSKFEAKPHESFLSENDVLRLRFVTWMLVTIRSGAAKDFKDGGENGFIIYVAEQEDGIDYYDILDKSLTWEKLKQFVFDILPYVSPHTYYLGNAFGFIDQIKLEDREFRHRENALKSVKSKVVRYLENEISSIEEKAISAAGKINSDDGTKFVYDKSKKFYTSEKQKDIAYCLKKTLTKRRWTDDELKSESHESIEKKLNNFWDKNVKDSANFINSLDSFKRGHGMPLEASEAYDFTFYLLKLNNYGYVLKEQCLTKSQLMGIEPKHLGPQSLAKNKKYKNWRENENLTISPDDYRSVVYALLEELLTFNGQERNEEQLQKILASTNSSASQWAYYPTLSLIRFIDTTLSKWLSSIKNIMGGVSIPDMFSDLIWVKKVALGRIEQLKKEAEDNLTKGKVNHLYMEVLDYSSFKLIWDESKHSIVEKKLGMFSNDAGNADLQAVECSLLSTGGEVGWIRGPSWFIPTSGYDTSKGHSKDITEKVSLVDPLVNAENAGKTLPEALTELKNQLKDSVIQRKFITSPLNLSKAISKYDSSAFWKANYHWQGGRSHDGQSSYIANAQAQFLRLSASADGSLNMPLSELKGLTPNLDLTSGASVKANFTLLSGQLGFSSWFPINDGDQNTIPKKGFHLDIPYVSRQPNSQANQRKIYQAGECFVKINAKVYGLAAASCSLSGNLSFGPSETDGGIGVKGKAIKLIDPNRADDISVNGRVVKDTGKDIPLAAAQIGAKVDVFAGVEAGGSIDAEVYWKPPSVTIQNTKIEQGAGKLGSIGAQLSANYGIGYSGELRFAFQNGEVILITSARAVCGPGFSGKFSVTLSPVLLDRFISTLLGVLKESGFRYVEIFGELDEQGKNPDFEELNERLTTAIALGIGFADVMLLPTVAYNEYKKEVLEEEYAPMIADHITGGEKTSQEVLRKKREWIKNLPPETLAKLLTCLTNAEDPPWIESQDARNARVLREQQKTEAIIQVFQWISQDINTGENLEYRQNQFEKTLIRMHGYLEEVGSPAAQWQRFADNWLRIEEFMKLYLSYIDQVSLTNFNRNTRLLSKNMRGYRYIDSNNKAHYRAYRAKSNNDSKTIEQDREQIKSVYGSDPRWKEFNEWIVQ